MTARRFATPACLAFLLALAGTAAAVQDCDIAGQSVNPNNGNTTAGKTGLMRCKDRDTGVLQREQELQNGKFMGLVRHYDDGKLKQEHSVNEKGNRHGRAREFAPDGTVLSDVMYENGSERGVSRRFHPNGQLRRATYFEADAGSATEKAYAEFNDRGQLRQLRCADRPVLAPVVDDARLCGFTGGPSRLEQFDDRGALSSRAGYLNGERVRYEQYYASGKTQLAIEVTDGKRTERSFSQDGVKRRDSERTLDGKRVVAERLQTFSEAGTLVREQRWNEGRAVSDANFYLNGQPRSRLDYGQTGTVNWFDETSYRDDGSVASKGRYTEINRSRRVPSGTHQVFNEAGKVVAESVYDDRGRVTRERAWDDAGLLVRDDAVFEDGSRKAFAK